MNEWSEIRPVHTPRMKTVVSVLQRATGPLSARQIGEAARLRDEVWWRVSGAVRPALRELEKCGWLARREWGVREKRTDPVWVFALTDKGRRLAVADFGDPVPDEKLGNGMGPSTVPTAIASDTISDTTSSDASGASMPVGGGR